jgi:hypothetical protein
MKKTNKNMAFGGFIAMHPMRCNNAALRRNGKTARVKARKAAARTANQSP